PLARKERLDAVANLITNLADDFQWLAFEIPQRPVVALQTRHDWTLIAASHRDQHLRSLRQFPCQLRRRGARQIDAHLSWANACEGIGQRTSESDSRVRKRR